MIQKIIGMIAERVLKKVGYSGYMSKTLYKDFVDDLYKTKMSLKNRLWGYRHGFLSQSVKTYGLNDSNYKHYESDFHYYRLHPLNEYAKWIDDKLTYRYILHPFSEYLPKYYFALKNGGIQKLPDCPYGLKADLSSIINLVNQEKQLAVKPLANSGGVGFFKLSEKEGIYLVNKETKNLNEITKALAALNRFVVTEYVISHDFIRKFYGDAPGSLRIMVVHNENEKPAIIAAFLRLGTTLSGVVDNVYAGGMVCGIDIKDGRLFQPMAKKGKDWVDTDLHIDTKIKIEGHLPHWGMIVSKTVEICEYISQLKYMGFDIIVTESGFKIIEINSHQSTFPLQHYYPLRKNAHFRKMIGRRLMV